ncbi:MAG: Rieske 2Fe-2S domain-containing protein [Candidatus Dormibacteria bacterium]
MTKTWIDRLIERQGWLEPVAALTQRLVGSAFDALGAPGQSLKSFLHGTKTGHPLHPALSDVPIGAWIGAVVADAVSHFTLRLPTTAGDVLLAVGLVCGLAAAVTGYTDFHETNGHERRTAIAHGLLMTGAMLLAAASMGLRWWAGMGWHPLAVGLAAAALGVLLTGAYLGGHLVFAIGTAVNHLAFVGGPSKFVEVGSGSDFPEGEMRRVEASGIGVLLVRRGGTLYGIAEVCTHAGGPLAEGTLEGMTVTCPWHGSRFCIRSGHPERGPATFPQPTFTVREENGEVSVKLGPASPRAPRQAVGESS